MQEEFLHGELLGYHTIGIAVDTLPVVLHLPVLLLDLRLVDGLVAYDPYNLVDDVVVVIGKNRQRHSYCQYEKQKPISKFTHNSKILFYTIVLQRLLPRI